ncbi:MULTISPECIES: peptidoglycan DD-metalloendopeptidase family protein [Legionella]|uniref:Peptidase M24 n=1 Tax=Legionella septentrionalis TaxID=2498109 RepID=A0A3S0X419_9GAMM|nr:MULTISPECIES: peptidoglycan DD-metalloendopeptidase family protein [Legionella]MCP0913750.1 peptidoglycan DD-metalloendopeptidase family protein [Legionella sp. 27cVA30]RUQ85391.1 peptidase M24 [Legionella septentrionalis]RUQ99305.1 peptidase M24 [Legionella septentrionalis]RUR09642.1 peptidase M24 [Legionella septentrionalis]RUR14782.1 peptidase M24 [Legionella septentrionalis]
MDLKPKVLPPKPAKPSKLLVIIILSAILLLPYFIIKAFRHKSVTYTNKTLSLPKMEELVDESEEEEESITESVNTAVHETQNKQTTVAATTEEEWKIITLQPGDSLSSIFKRLGLSPQTLQAILYNNPHAKALANLKAKQQLQILIRNHALEKMIVPLDQIKSLTIAKQGNQYKSEINSRKMDSHEHYVTATIQGSLYSTAKRKNIPYKLIQQMTEIFKWEIDFSKEVRAGDQFTIVYKAFFIENKLVNTGDIVAVSYTNRGKTHQAIRHTRANGDYDYFSPQGTSLKKAFSRYPVQFSHISSTFSLSRYHPILKRRRPHKGVDLAAPIGTPIRAIGDGRIESIGRQNGYGNMIKIKHDQNHSSIYGHMLKFQKGLSRGDRVKRGQIIGYVGQTGLATGPHCHYEFHINKQPKNPTTVDLPRASPIPAREMAAFKAHALALFAQMKLYEEAQLASNKKSARTA